MMSTSALMTWAASTTTIFAYLLIIFNIQNKKNFIGYNTYHPSLKSLSHSFFIQLGASFFAFLRPWRWKSYLWLHSSAPKSLSTNLPVEKSFIDDSIYFNQTSQTFVFKRLKETLTAVTTKASTSKGMGLNHLGFEAPSARLLANHCLLITSPM